MYYLYYEQEPIETERIITNKLLESTTIFDSSTNRKYIRIGASIDIETSKIQVSDEFVTAYCYHWQFGFGDLAVLGRSLDSMHLFLTLLIELITKLRKKAKLMILDANLGYEWQFCKHYWSQLQITKLFAKEERDPLSIEISNTLEIREVLGLFGVSLAQIAKNYTNMEKLKGDLDYNQTILSNTPMSEKEIGYTVRDVEILVALANYIYEHFFGKNPRLPYTSTGIIRDAIKKEFGAGLKAQKQLIKSWMPSDEYEYELFRRYLFKGGISGSNVKLADRVLEHVVGADITSDYPFQMLTKKFPWGKATVVNSREFCKEKKPYIATIVFINFKAKSQHALMSAHKVINSKEMINSKRTVLDNNRIQFAERAELVVNDVEYKALKRAYKWDNAIVKKCWIFKEGYKPLPAEIRRVIIRQYLKKEELKHEYKNTQEYRDAKAFVNGIFGMSCTALYFEDLAFIEDMCAIGANKRRKYEDCINNLFMSPYWGFWITSYARAMLMDVITRFPNVIIQYDTDSVYYVNKGEEAERLCSYLQSKNKCYRDLNDVLFYHNERMLSLGTWEIDTEFRRFKGLGSKRYMYEDTNGNYHVTIAGCRKYMDENEKERSTLIDQMEWDDLINDTKTDPFDYFAEGMYIDEAHSRKLASKYVDKSWEGEYMDRDGNVEHIKCPSSIVLIPIPFTMRYGRMGNSHKTYGDLITAVKRFEINSPKGYTVYGIWQKLNELN